MELALFRDFFWRDHRDCDAIQQVLYALGFEGFLVWRRESTCVETLSRFRHSSAKPSRSVLSALLLLWSKTLKMTCSKTCPALLALRVTIEHGERLFLVPGIYVCSVSAEDEAGITMPLPLGDQADVNFLLNQVDDESTPQ